MQVFLLVAIATALPCTLAACANFTAQVRSHGDTSFTSTFNTLRVSEIVDCNASIAGSSFPADSSTTMRCNSTQCPLSTPPDYLVRLNRTLNLTVSEDIADDVFELVQPYMQLGDNTNLNASYVYRISEVATCLNEGVTGSWGFTPIYRCVDGTLSDCDDGDPADGTPLRACGIATLGLGQPDIASGDLLVVIRSGDESAPAPPNATLTDEENSAGERQRVSWSLVFPLLMATVVGACLGC